MAKNPKSRGKSMTAVKVRQDLFVYNEATAFVITSNDLRGREYAPGDGDWEAAVLSGEMIPIELYQDDSFYMRVIVNDKLTPQENAEWVGKMSRRLKVGDGKLVIAAGIEFVMENYGDDDSWLSDYCRTVDIPAGSYRADVYTYIHSVNAEPLLSLAQSENNEWQDVSFDDEEVPYIGFLLHLSPVDDQTAQDDIELSDGFFNVSHCTARKPDKCPLGLKAENVQGLPPARQYVPPPARGVDVSSLVRLFEAERLSEVVSIPLSEMHHAYILAWHCTDSSHPELVIRGSSVDKLKSAPLPERAEVVALDDAQTSVRLELHDGRWETVKRMRTLAQSLEQHHSNQVEHMELCCAKPGTGAAGTLRFGGKVAGGVWHIEETFPALSVVNLRSALNLVREAEEGTVLRLDDAEAIAHALALFKEEWGPLFRESMPQLDGNTVTLSSTDASELHLLSTFYLRLAFGEEFPVEPIDTELLLKVDRARQKEAFATQLIFQGAGRQFVSTSVSLMDEEAVDDCAETDETMQEMGAQLIGDLTCSAFSGFVFRYYALPDGHSRLVWMRREGGFFPTMIQIISDFNDGSTLFTSTSTVKPDEPEKKIYRLGYPAGSLPELYEKHIERCEELRKTHEGFKALEPSLLECAKRFDESMSRQS